MPRDPKYDVLFEPIKIGPKVSKNRFYQTPHATSFGVERPGAHAKYRGMKAEGGWGVVNTGFCQIHPETEGQAFVGARLWDADDVRSLSLMVEEIHQHDALAGVELWYSGACIPALNYETRMPVRAVTAVPSGPACFAYGYAMDKDEIRELQALYVAAARRARDAGFDLVNMMSDEVTTIFESFLMTRFNKRTDEYGGTLENRARLALETLELVREAVGEDCGIVMRLCVDTGDATGKGILVDETCQFISMADHLVDLWDLQVGGWEAEHWAEDAGSSRFHAENFQAAVISKVRPYTQKQIVGVGRFTNPDTMVDVIARGQLDLIGGARPSIADPFLPRKIEEGRLDQIRECIGCNICASRINQMATIVCTQNATIGEEYRRGWHPEKFTPAENADEDVLIVGAGPAGMECAIVLAKRGVRRIHMVDAGPEIGGSLRWISRLPGLGEWARVINWRAIQLSKLKSVQFIPNTTLDVESIREYGADQVVVATGAHWATDGLNGFTHEPLDGVNASLPYVLTPEQVMEGKAVPGDRVLIYDCDGYYAATCLAEKLATDGKEVRLVSALPAVGAYTAFTMEAADVQKRLVELGIEQVTSRVLVSVEPGRAVAAEAGDLTLEPIDEWPMDAVVLVTQRLPHDDLYRELKNDVGAEALARDGIKGLYRIGDCVAPRLIADAVFDGHRLAREIDSADPARPLPYIRERRVLGPSDEDHQAALAAVRSAHSVASR